MMGFCSSLRHFSRSSSVDLSDHFPALEHSQPGDSAPVFSCMSNEHVELCRHMHDLSETTATMIQSGKAPF